MQNVYYALSIHSKRKATVTSTSNSNLLILNFSMDSKHPALSHQISTVNSLSPYFEEIVVLTGQHQGEMLAENVYTYNTNWREGQNLRNLFRFYREVRRIFRDHKPEVIFSHMNEVFTFLILPFARLKRIPVCLWYAHTNKSLFLRLIYPFVDSVLTSTGGSCPYAGKKVTPIGQSIDFQKFYRQEKKISLKNLVHVGRLDPSKDIANIIRTFIKVESKFPGLSLTFIGVPSTNKSEMYLQKLKDHISDNVKSDKIKFIGAVSRLELPEVLAKFDLFIHSYVGSLDKAILEATSVGLPVVTINQEFINEFGNWSQANPIELEDELTSCLNLPLNQLEVELKRRQSIVQSAHSSEAWLLKVSHHLKHLSKDNNW